jgi:hypothetical protein
MAKTHSIFVPRPLEGLPLESALVAMREILPAAVATARDVNGGEVRFVTLLPELERCWRQSDAVPIVALQPPTSSDDVSRDLGNALIAALNAEPGQPGVPHPLGADGPRLQELLDPDGPTSFTLLDSLEYWADLDTEDEGLAEAGRRAADDLPPTEQVGDILGTYWTKISGREYLRWSIGVEEDVLLDGLARLQARRLAGLGPGSQYAGMFRTLGLAIPVWNLPAGTSATDLVEPVTEFKARLEAALSETAPLDANERRARAGLVARSLTTRHS